MGGDNHASQIMILLAALLLFDGLSLLSKVILSPRSPKGLNTRLGQSRACSLVFSTLLNYKSEYSLARGIDVKLAKGLAVGAVAETLRKTWGGGGGAHQPQT